MSVLRTSKSKKINNFIPGIYNYCDNWCERCPFVKRCKKYSDEEEYDSDVNEKQLNDKLDLLIENTERIIAYFNIPYPVTISEQIVKPEVVQGNIFDEENISMEHHPLTRLNHIYYILTHEYQQKWVTEYTSKKFDEDDGFLKFFYENEESSDYDDEDIIDYYVSMIRSKLESALFLLEDGKIYVDKYGINVYADGYAKCALLLIDKSKQTWDKMYAKNPESTDDMISVYVALNRIRKLTIQLFPEAMNFILPGFDDKVR